MLRALTAVAVMAASVLVPARAAIAAPITVGGFVYHDRNNNGVRDIGEPGVAGVRVHHGSSGRPTAATDANGAYSLTGVPQSGNLLVETGWFRSQCNAMDCAAGPGADNDFTVANQFIKFPVAAGQPDVSDLNVGLVPDWPGASLSIPAPVAGVVPANAVDVAARLSGTTSACAEGGLGICRPGDTFGMALQLHNQGTTALTGVRAKLFVPPGDCLTDAALQPDATSPGITSVAVTAHPCGTRQVEFTFTGTLTPGGLIRVGLTGTVDAAAPGPGTPGCVIGAPQATCSSGEPQGRAWIAGVSRIDQSGDPDSVGFCANSGPQLCATGIHDKRREPDEVDVVGHNLDAALGGSTAVDLHMRLQARKPEPAVVHPGDAVTVRAWLHNEDLAQTGNQANPGATVTLLFPKGSALTVPPNHSLLQCAIDTSGADAERARCTLRGPLSPYAGSLAVDVTTTIPAAWPLNTTYKVVACAAPAAGQTESIGPGASCLLTTDVFNSPTNNDDAKKFTVT